jgi:hypothetical protein
LSLSGRNSCRQPKEIVDAGQNAQLFDFILSKEIRPYVTDAVLEEYSRVFGYERLKHLDKRRTARLIGIMERVAVKVKSPGRLKISGHGDDDGTAAVLVAA